MAEEDLRQQSDIFLIESVVRRGCMVFCLVSFGVMAAAIPLLTTQPLMVTLFCMVMLVVPGVFLWDEFKRGGRGRFYLAANNDGWFFRSSTQHDNYIFFPWSECLEISSEISSTDGMDLRIRVLNSQLQLENIPSPENGWMSMSEAHIDFYISGGFNVKSVVKKLRRLKRIAT